MSAFWNLNFIFLKLLQVWATTNLDLERDFTAADGVAVEIGIDFTESSESSAQCVRLMTSSSTVPLPFFDDVPLEPANIFDKFTSWR